MKLVVIGGVAAGMSAASQAKRRRPETEVVVLEQGRDVSYGACGMPYNVADPGREVEDLVVVRAEEFRKKRGLDLRLGHRAHTIDRAGKQVRGVDAGGREFEQGYDKLVLATGSRAVRPEVEGIDGLGVFSLRTLEDARLVKAWLAGRPCRDAVVIGGSYLGLELAEALVARGLKVTIVKRSPPLLGFLPAELDALLKAELEARGVAVIHGDPLKRIEPGARLSVELEGRALPADLVMVCAGFAPRSELGLEAGLAAGPSRSIAVDREGKSSDPEIFAAGDCSDHFHAITGARVWVPLALHANRAGRIVGGNAIGETELLPGVLGTSAVRVFGLEAAGTGLGVEAAARAGFAPVAETIKAQTRAHAFPGSRTIHVHLVADRESGRLLGAAIVGQEYGALRIDVVAAAISGGMTVRDFSNLDLMYTPPFTPAWDPLLVAANQLVKKV